MGKLRRLSHWLELRSGRYIMSRSLTLLTRYGLTSTKARRRIFDCIRLLARYNCYPTFPVPGCVVEKNAKFCRELQDLGVEIAVHGYDHVDFRGLSPEEATDQFIKATDTFYHSGIRFEGFRCPYLSYTDSLSETLPEGIFKYSSNKAIWWNVLPAESTGGANAIFNSLNEFYQPESSEAVVATPRMSGDLLEIPASLPDDIQLYDGLRLGEEGVASAWTQMLHRMHQRGELFVLLFHPESFQHCKLAFEIVLKETKLLRPAVWITQLRHVSRWWREKAGFVVNVSFDALGLRLSFSCSERATVLVRNLELDVPTRPWDDAYQVLENRTLHLKTDQLPFIGVSSTVPSNVVSFLREQGYIVNTCERAQRCSLYLDKSTAAGLNINNQVQLLAYIESSTAPLVRFWRWPDEKKSALCITGDLDAVSLVDYALRPFTS